MSNPSEILSGCGGVELAERLNALNGAPIDTPSFLTGLPPDSSLHAHWLAKTQPLIVRLDPRVIDRNSRQEVCEEFLTKSGLSFDQTHVYSYQRSSEQLFVYNPQPLERAEIFPWIDKFLVIRSIARPEDERFLALNTTRGLIKNGGSRVVEIPCGHTRPVTGNRINDFLRFPFKDLAFDLEDLYISMEDELYLRTLEQSRVC